MIQTKNTRHSTAGLQYNSNSITSLLDEFREMRSRPRRYRRDAINFLRFQVLIDVVPKDIADSAIWELAEDDAEALIQIDPFLQIIEADQTDLARKFGMWDEEHTCYRGFDYDRIPGMPRLSARWCKRLDEMAASHLEAWGQTEMLAAFNENGSNAFPSSNDLLNNYASTQGQHE